MAILSKNPPRSLLIEGGSAKDRFSASFYWSALLNCLDSAARPCLSCSACLSLINMAQRDFFFFDGSKSSITIELVKDSGIYASLGENPASASYRIVLFYEGQAFTDQSANTFLKALEDPQLSTVFILTAPQRERLLQTLVSRSWVITLPWPSLSHLQNRKNQEQLLDLAGCLLDFVTGKNAF
ncbi:MAG: DNA polymerase III subunit delta', partial [Deltaproteobacteria bacterium]|nr:DNA polymerase III subunit delta' [Deltaproteobacteria bacterium]